MRSYALIGDVLPEDGEVVSEVELVLPGGGHCVCLIRPLMRAGSHDRGWGLGSNADSIHVQVVVALN